MNEQQLSALIKQSEIESSSDFTDKIMRQVIKENLASMSMPVWMSAIGIVACLLLVTALPLGVQALVDWIASVTGESATPLALPLKLLSVLFTLYCFAQIMKASKAHFGAFWSSNKVN
ncbi:MAG: hypothetical protein HWE26_07645 [Alteromonadaceae bacterium]|nr:hypothetical protein [Alteromonadaceae bacterium]